jgi:hypothetical protein
MAMRQFAAFYSSANFFHSKFGHRRRSPTSPESYSHYASNQPKTEGANEFHAELHTWVSPDPTKSSVDATLVPADPTIATGPKNDWASIKWPLLDRRISRAIVFLITFCIGVAAFLAWQSSREMTASAPQTARVAPSPNLEQQLEAISLGLTTLRQSVDQLAASLGQMRNDITNLQTAQQAIFDKVSEPAPRPAAAAAPTPKATPRPSQAPPVR